ncbi:MAG TPA: HD domain-containing phosphohydrolase [Gammaproteobacteria bacterium]
MYATHPITLLDFVIAIASAVDQMDARVACHHKRVAYIASQIAREMRVPLKTQHDLIIAGLLHDIGSFSVSERNLLSSYDEAEDNTHCEAGYLLLNKFRHFFVAATIIRHHHREYSQRCTNEKHHSVAMESMLLHLADRIEVLIDKGQPVLEQVDRIVATIARDSGTRFNPDHVDAFAELAWRESFWLDVVSPTLERELVASCRNHSVELDNNDLLELAEFVARVVDFRSHFTATHSSGVASVATELASLVGFSEVECRNIRLAGYLHDVGKLVIPLEILQKEGKLSSAEFRTIKSHAYHTHRILEPLQGFKEIRSWASMHHERLDGNGYPGRYHAAAIPLGARIIAIADVFTALLEDRPYRKSLGKVAVIQQLQDLAQRKVLDRKVVEVLLANFENIDTCRCHAQSEARQEYLRFGETIAKRSKPQLLSTYEEQLGACAQCMPLPGE